MKGRPPAAYVAITPHLNSDVDSLSLEETALWVKEVMLLSALKAAFVSLTIAFNKIAYLDTMFSPLVFSRDVKITDFYNM